MDEIDPRVEVIHGRERPFWLPYLDETCDATAIVGAHAKAGTEGACLCHTMSLAIRDWSGKSLKGPSKNPHAPKSSRKAILTL